MPAILNYGRKGRLSLDLPADALIADFTGPSSTGEGIAEAVAHAVENPLEFPPLQKAVVPGDRIVISLGAAVPEADEIVAALIAALMKGNVAADDVTIVQSQADGESARLDPRGRLSGAARGNVQLQTHESTVPEELSYLAANAQGEPIYLNRTMCEADLVIPVGYLQPDDVFGRNGAHGVWNETLYPTFGDRKTIDHFAANGVPLSAGQLAHRHKQIDQVAWLLGVQFTLQVVPGGGDRAGRVLAGSPQAVFQQARTCYRSAWTAEVPRRSHLVIAGLGGGPNKQTWASLYSALEGCLPLVSEGGAIALCSELECEPGPALKSLAAAVNDDSILARLRKLRSPDAPLARLLVEWRDRTAIYLLSRLSESAVEPLGIAHVTAPEEIARLATHLDSCILLADAQYARPSVVGEPRG